MKKQLTIFLLFVSGITFSQTENDWKKSAFTINPVFLYGKTMKANEHFPKREFQKQIVLNFGWYHTNNPQQWAQRLKGPKTGLSIGVTDFGNLDDLGLGFTAMPFIEFKAFGSERWKIFTGMGGSYFTNKFNVETNPHNRAVTTDVTWAFQLYLYHQFLSTKNVDWRMGIGYSHHSNGHMRLMNQGYNSFLVALSADIKNPLKNPEILQASSITKNKESVYDYFAFRGGLGQNAFAMAFNDKKNVYTVAGEYGRFYNHIFKIGIGFYSRFYQHYYDYIQRDESLVQDEREFDYFKSNPWYYSSNIGLTIHGEIFLNHIGIDLQAGYNLHKPAYKMEYRINAGWKDTPREISETWVLGTLGSKYKIKYRISSRIGLKYYLIGMEKAPENNFYIGAHINTNLGQADFSELSFGYVYSFNFRDKK